MSRVLMPLCIACTLTAALFGMLIGIAVSSEFELHVTPGNMTLLMMAVVFCFLFYVRQLDHVSNKYQQGRDGEILVAEAFALLSDHKTLVLHDLPCDGFNIDHVVVHPSGVYALETKTLSRHQPEHTHLRYDGNHVYCNGKALPRDPVTQARGTARNLHNIIAQLTGYNVWVNAVVLFPGWDVHQDGRNASTPPVVSNPRQFIQYLNDNTAHTGKTLQPECMKTIWRQLRDHARQTNRQRREAS